MPTENVKKLLIIDDEPHFYDQLFRFNSNVWQKVYASSEREVDRVITHQGIDAFSLIILDLSLDGSGNYYNGLQFLIEIIGSTESRIPVLVITSDTNPDSYKYAMNAGAAGYLQKNYYTESLCAAIIEEIVKNYGIQDVAKTIEYLLHDPAVCPSYITVWLQKEASQIFEEEAFNKFTQQQWSHYNQVKTALQSTINNFWCEYSSNRNPEQICGKNRIQIRHFPSRLIAPMPHIVRGAVQTPSKKRAKDFMIEVERQLEMGVEVISFDAIKDIHVQYPDLFTQQEFPNLCKRGNLAIGFSKTIRVMMYYDTASHDIIEVFRRHFSPVQWHFPIEFEDNRGWHKKEEVFKITRFMADSDFNLLMLCSNLLDTESFRDKVLNAKTTGRSIPVKLRPCNYNTMSELTKLVFANEVPIDKSHKQGGRRINEELVSDIVGNFQKQLERLRRP